jgi:hypothetical protein
MHPLSRLLPRLIAPLGAALLSWLPVSPASALALQPALVSFTPGVVGGNELFAGTIGWDFSLDRPYNVGALGFYDAEDPGLLASHTVGIFDATSQQLLVSTVIPAGELAELQNGFRWRGIRGIILPPGSYVIAAVLPGTGSTSFDPFVALGEDAVMAPGVVLAGRSLTGAASPASLVFPGNDEGAFAGFFGPNFAKVPGPLPLAGAATALAWSRRLRRHRRGSVRGNPCAPGPSEASRGQNETGQSLPRLAIAHLLLGVAKTGGPIWPRGLGRSVLF